MFDLVLMGFDGSIVVALQDVSLVDASKIVLRWNAFEEQSSILVWPSKIALPEWIAKTQA